jgi:hypothetical protein
MNTPSKPESSMRLIIFLVGVMVVIGLFSRNNRPAKTSKIAVPTIALTASKEEAPKPLPSAGASAALKALRAESKIKDVLYQPGRLLNGKLAFLTMEHKDLVLRAMFAIFSNQKKRLTKIRLFELSIL